jgi:hypothetical protein
MVAKVHIGDQCVVIGWKEGWMERWMMEGWMDGWADRKVIHIKSSVKHCNIIQFSLSSTVLDLSLFLS